MLITRQLSPQHGGGQWTTDLSADVLRSRKNEHTIMRRTIKEAAKQGWKCFALHDGDEEYKFLSVKDAILIADNLDEITFYFKKGDEAGWVFYIFGNGNNGYDVITDYSVSLEPFMSVVNEYVETLDTV